MRMLLRDTVLRTVRTVHAGVRMVLRDTVLRTVRTVHAAGVRMCEDV